MSETVFLSVRTIIIENVCTPICFGVEASGSYSDIHLRDRSRIVVALRIGVMGRYLPASHFVRIHRSYVVSLFDIDTFVGNMLRIGDKWFPIGRLYRPGVLALLNILNYVCRSPEDGG